MEFFSGFKWAVPAAFSDAVAFCCFEEGDTLYDTKDAYIGDWESASKKIEYSLQVRYPIKANRVATRKREAFVENGAQNTNDRNPLKNNWNSEVRIELYKNHRKVSAGQIQTTQGRLYTMLWKGDISVLYESTDNPGIPKTVKDYKDYIDETRETAARLSEGAATFVMARDLSNEVSREKYLKILAVLRKHLIGDPYVLTARDAGISQHESIAPTVEIAFFVTKEIDRDNLHDLVKSAVYVPAKNARKDRFSMSRHGAIF